MDSPQVFRIDKQDSGIAIIWIDVPGEPVNVLRADFAAELDTVLAMLSGDAEVRAAVLASAKPSGFIAGADIRMLQSVQAAEDGVELSRSAQRIAAKVEAFSKPIVAAIDGICLGGGLELALACHARVASDDPKTRLGLPEVQLGVLPAMGGTQRLPRRVGVQLALDLLLSGRQLNARRARRAGLIDEVAPKAILLTAAKKRALTLVDRPKPGRYRGSHPVFDALMVENPLGRRVLFQQAKKRALAKTQGNYPAPERILDVVKLGLAKGVERGLEAEAEAFGDLLMTPEAAQLMSLYFAQNELKKDSGVDDTSVQPALTSNVGVLGAGLMGSGIAYVTVARAGLPARLKDRDDNAVARGLRSVSKLLDEQMQRGKYSQAERDRLMTMVTAGIGYEGFNNAELVIEAVFEDLTLKHEVLRAVEEVSREDMIFASNTSSLPIARIAEASRRPEQVIGMHYFSPVHKMPLLEVIRTQQTAPWVVASAVAIGKRQGKTVIVVNDGPGFYTTRILVPYMNEAAFLLEQGASIESIDQALVSWGFPVGPLTLLDEIGIDVGQKVGKVMVEAAGDRLTPPASMQKLLLDGRLGRKTQRGFYAYDNGKKAKGKRKPVDKTVYTVLGVEPHSDLTQTAIAQRCALQMVNEAARCLEEGVLRSARDGDIGAVFGLGFPPFRGGPFRYVDEVGAGEIVRRLERYRAELGSRFEPAPLLRQLAEGDRRFHHEN